MAAVVTPSSDDASSGGPALEAGGDAHGIHVVLVDCGSKKVPDLARIVEELGAHCQTVTLAAAAHHRFAPTDAVVVSGGPHLFTREPELVGRFAFVDTISGPLLGICLGLQAIALRHSATLFRGAERRGPERIEIRTAHPLTAGLGRAVTLVADHCEGVTLPEGFALLGSSAHYPVELMACDARRRYGVQCHPEVSGPAGRQLLAAFLALGAAGHAHT
jgi:GMP synthase-like glutamine amidotransferase